jgi:hypothetical protein
MTAWRDTKDDFEYGTRGLTIRASGDVAYSPRLDHLVEHEPAGLSSTSQAPRFPTLRADRARGARDGWRRV